MDGPTGSVHFTAVYLTDDDLPELCRDISRNMTNKGWEIIDDCSEREIESGELKIKYKLFTFRSLLRKPFLGEIDHFVAGFYPKSDLHPHIPYTNRDHDIFLRAVGTGKSLYFASYNYEGFSNFKKYNPCGDLGVI